MKHEPEHSTTIARRRSTRYATLIISTLLASTLANDQSTTTATDSQFIKIIRAGSRPVELASADHFTGTVHIEPLFEVTPRSRASGGSVSFDAGGRSAWHTHPRGQVLIVTAGAGRVQRWGAPIQEIRQGDVVWIPPGVKHWHGAAPTTAITHIAIQEEMNGKVVDWLEPVSKDQYSANPSTGGTPMPNDNSVPRGPYADVAPALDALTKNVLFGEVWERPSLSKRDRSLITVATLVALYRTNELPFHLKRALDNGVTKDELVELITHMAFYAGWPPASTAVSIARQVFADSAR